MATQTKARFFAPHETELDAEERMSRDELEALQLTRLQWTVRHAYENVAIYRRKFDDLGVQPGDIRELSDTRLLPLTSKEDLRASYPYGLFTGGLGAHAGIEELGATVIPMSGGQTARQVQLILDFEPDVILCTPTYLLTIVDCMVEQGIDPRRTSLKAGVLGAEPWTTQMRQELEEQLDIDALDIYGLSEVMGPGVGNECIETKDGPHLWEDHFLLEVIDSESGATLPDGEAGELVFTSLTKEAFPVLRYRTRDLTTLHPGSARPGMRRMEKITGRNDDMIILRGVNLLPTQIEEIALGIDALSPHFLLELSRRGRMDDLLVRIEPRPDADAAARERAAAILADRIKVQIGTTVRVQLDEPGALERSAGELKRPYDLR
jgi:phenylacetate-CoA ligase